MEMDRRKSFLIIQSLPDLYRHVMKLRHGFGRGTVVDGGEGCTIVGEENCEPHTLSEVCTLLGLSPQTVIDIEQEACMMLRAKGVECCPKGSN